ncbi:hypothetical protein AJ80_02246 [Polytolypa hystricis UAMH7299]|uniref:DNA-directed RNA polymerase II subunit RPB9-like zinc ribbon domain-containing protein n=1 Tax=Polytolypa hystricis (strain UAMH7299) TaxID=1447883 RepID=A0A2B7YR39_POLH7|nr:hypothetical protein AJ80_02246 [Polytolypa hystricis UAMH7299]
MSASPMSGTGGDQQQQGIDQIHFKFCRECSNLLYPKEDRANNTLMFTCRTCHVGEPASSHCVFQNKLHSQVGDTAGVTQDVGSDPTVGLPYCTLCGDEIDCAVCGQSFSESFSNETAIIDRSTATTTPLQARSLNSDLRS